MKVFTMFVASSLICMVPLMAQEPDQKNKSESKKEKAASAEDSHADQEIAAMKLAECRGEVELSKIAQKKSKNPQVQKFAAMMVKDHEEACALLKQWAGGDAVKHSEDANESAKSDNSAEQTAKGRHDGKTVNWVAIHQEMGERCLAAAKKELAEKDGPEFDKCFMTMQVVGHQKTIIADEVFAKYVSSGNRAKIEKCRETATDHLAAAKAICKELDSTSVASDAPRSK